jgi:hypothetical protein
MKNFLYGLTFLQPFIVDGAALMLRLFLGVAAVFFLLHALLSIFFPYPLDYGEAPLIDQAMRLSAGQNIYRPDLSSPPYTVANYPPLYPLTLVPFANSSLAFLAGRAISTLSALASALFLGLIIYSYSKDRLAALTTALIFLAIPYVVHWSGLLRVDLLALALSLAALYLLVRSPVTRRSVIAAGLLLVAAIYTRQSYALAAPLAAFVWLWRQERRRAIELALLVGGASLILFILLNLLTGSGFFFNIVTANVNEFSMDRLGRELEGLAFMVPILLALGLLLLVRGRGRLPFWPFFAAYLIGALLSTLTIGKIGSNVNYFLEMSAALALVAGVFVFWSQPYPWRHVAFLILLALQTGWLLQATLEKAFDERLIWRRSEAVALADLADLVAKAEGPILADEFMGLITLKQQPLYLQPFETTQLEQAGIWDQTALLEAIQQKSFPLILIYQLPSSSLHRERWTPEMLSAIEENYRPVRVEALTTVYRPQEEGQAGLAVPEPTQGETFNSDQVRMDPLSRIGQQPYVLQPEIAANPLNPDHLAALVTTTSFAECENFSECETDLMLYISTDGGQSWQEQRPFSKPRQFTAAGSLGFGPDGTLYVVSIRDESVTLKQGHSDTDYEISDSAQKEVTRAQVSPKPWLRIEPETGALFLSYAAQFQNTLVMPSLNRSTDAGATWSFTARADQSVALADVNNGRSMPPGDVQVLLGDDDHVAMVWIWGQESGGWPRDVWLATSTDGGENFSPPSRIAETWGPINTASQGSNYYIVYRSGTEQSQALGLAFSDNNGRTWRSTLISSDIPLNFDIDKAPGLGVAPDGTIDLLFYVQADGGAGCALDLQRWQQALDRGWTDTCAYHVYYTYSQDGGQSFSEPLRLDITAIQGNRFVQIAGFSQAGSHMGMASTDAAAYPIWIETQGQEGTQAVTVRLER